jgi:hypothetical protein
MLTGYFDESGVHKGDHLCVVAGYFGDEAQWSAFANDWIKALGRMKNLHMKRLRWHKPERVGKLLPRLGPILRMTFRNGCQHPFIQAGHLRLYVASFSRRAGG